MIQKLGKYSIVSKLGEGAMGAVYKAYDQILDRHVAIKTMAEDIKWDPELKLRFYREARSAASLHHPNIVTIHDLGEEGKITYIVMELLQGKELKKIIREKETLSLEKRLSIMVQVAEGLSHAHKNGIIHRDVKPGNIHLSETGTVKLLDFGIARIPSSDLTRSGVRLGTPIYMSPEQIRGSDYDERSDIFSAGIVLYELLTYVHPFRDKNITTTLDNILFQTHFPFADQMPDAPPELWPILQNCLAKEPDQRYRSMAELGRACRRLQEEMSGISTGMIRDLQSMLPGIRQVTEGPHASPGLSAMRREAESLLAGEEKPDYLSLKQIMKKLAAEPAVLPGRVSPEEPRAGTPAEPPLAAPSTGPSRPSGATGRSSEHSTSFEPPIPAETSDSIQSGPPTPSPEELRGLELLKSGQERLREDRLEEALELLRQAMGLLGPEQQVVNALAQTRQRIDERRRARVAALLHTARQAILAGKPEETVHAADEILNLEPNHPEAVEMRRQAFAELEAERVRRARRESGEREKMLAMKLLSEEKYRESLIALRRAAEILEEDASIRAAIKQAEEGLRAAEIRSQVEAELAAARNLFHHEDFDDAAARAQRALEISPASNEALELLHNIERTKETRIRQQAERDKAAGFRLLAEKKFRESLAALRRASEILKEDPAVHLGIEEAQEGIRADELRARVMAELSEAERLLSSGDFEQAGSHAQRALELSPKNTEARDLLDRIQSARESRRKSDEIAVLLGQSRESLQNEDFDGSEQRAREVLLLDPVNSPAAELLSRIALARKEKALQQQLEQLLAESKEALLADRFGEAVARAQDALVLSPHNPQAQDMLTRAEKAEKDKQTREQVAFFLEQCKLALSRENLTDAMSQVREALRLDPANVEASDLRKEVEQIRQERKQSQIESLLSQGRQALSRGDFRQASVRAQEIMVLDPQNADAANLLQGVEDAREKQHRDKIASLLFECQQERNRGDFEKANSLAGELLEIDPANKEAKSLARQISKDIRSREKEFKKQQKKRTPAREARPAAEELDETLIVAEPEVSRRIPKTGIWLGSAAVVLALAGIILFRVMPTRPSVDSAAQIASARALIQQGDYQRAIAALEAIVNESPANEEAQGLLSTARGSLQAQAIDGWLLEAGNKRSEGKYEEALASLRRILDRIPDHEQALALKGQIETAQVASGSKADQDQVVQAWLASVPDLIRTGQFEKARVELEKVVQIRPEDPEALRLGRRLDRAVADSKKQQETMEATLTTDRQSRKAASQVEDLISIGKYEEAQDLLDRWAKEIPNDARAVEFQSRNSELIRHFRAYGRLMSERRYSEALNQVQQLEKLNSSDPNLAEYRRRAEERRAEARVVISVHRMGDPATLITLDDQPLSTNGEVEGRSIPAGMHKLTVRGARWQGEILTEFIDGQNYAYVYDLSRRLLRALTSEDREAVAARREREKIRQWNVEHDHPGLFAGKCDGLLIINGFQVEYKPEKVSTHAEVLPFQVLQLKIDGDKLEFIDARSNRRWQRFKPASANQVKTIQALWDNLVRLAKQSPQQE